jgi:hypothetical protein
LAEIDEKIANIESMLNKYEENNRKNLMGSKSKTNEEFNRRKEI